MLSPVLNDIALLFGYVVPDAESSNPLIWPRIGCVVEVSSVLKFKEPKIIKKELFNDDCYDLGELYSQIKNCHDRDPYNEMEVSFTSKLEF